MFELEQAWPGRARLLVSREFMACARAAAAGRSGPGLQTEVSARLDAAGMVFLAWADLGWSHLFSINDPRDTDHSADGKWWVWERDRPMSSVLQRAGLQLDHRAVPEVLNALATRTISGCYGSPNVIIALDWKDHLRFAVDPPLSFGIGMLVIEKQSFARLSARDKEAIRRVAADIGRRLHRLLADGYTAARRSLEEDGVQFVDLPSAQLEKLRATADATRPAHASSPSAKQLLERIVTIRAR